MANNAPTGRTWSFGNDPTLVSLGLDAVRLAIAAHEQELLDDDQTVLETAEQILDFARTGTNKKENE